MFQTSSTAEKLLRRAEALRQRMDAQHRIDLASDMADALDQSDEESMERKLALEIINHLIEDEIIAVRAAIAEAIAGSPYLPARIARKLSLDIAEVSIPVLELSPVLEERVLETIIATGMGDKISAIARRKTVSTNISRRIVASGRKNAVVHLLNNPGAQITDQTMTTIVRVYGDDERIEQALFDRGELPDEVVENLKELTEAHVCSFVQRYFNLPEHMVDVEKGRKLLEQEEENKKAKTQWWDKTQGVV